MDKREVAGPPAEKDDRDLLDVLMSLRDDEGALRFSADTITGMFISMMFAGHHTTSGTAAWTLIELLRHPEEMAAVLVQLAKAVRLPKYQKNTRGPKKPQPAKQSGAKIKHVATSKILAARKLCTT